MGLWEVSEVVLSHSMRQQDEEGVPCYSHISHRALEDIPKEYTNPYNCKVRALAFNNNHKVSHTTLLALRDNPLPVFPSTNLCCNGTYILSLLIFFLGAWCSVPGWLFSPLEGRAKLEQGRFEYLWVRSAYQCLLGSVIVLADIEDYEDLFGVFISQC